ncbi:MAG: methylamine utilization protein [Novosphingobium sp.]
MKHAIRLFCNVLGNVCDLAHMTLPKPLIPICASAFLLAGILPAIETIAAPSGVPLQVVDQAGMPLRDAVIEIAPLAGDTRRPAFSWRNAMAQRNLAFLPGTLIVPKGATVAFPNLDTVRHSIYSFSKPGPFRIDLYGQEQTRSQKFDNAGTIALGCNIHDTMQGYVRVVSTPYATAWRRSMVSRAEAATLSSGTLGSGEQGASGGEG